MNIYKYQAKELFEKYNISVPHGKVGKSADEVLEAIKTFPEKIVVLKAQVYTGGRGKAGGIKKPDNIEDAKSKVSNILSMQIIRGYNVKKVLVEEQLDTKQELYLSFILNRDNECYKLIFSEAGGTDIEELAATQPEKLIIKDIEYFSGLTPFQSREIIFSLKNVERECLREIYNIANNLYRLFIETKATLAEITPLVITKDNRCIACDAKINLDDNALFRHKDLMELRIPQDENPLEREAKDKGLSYIKLNGNIGCMVNGAGLAMATMDVIKHFGGEPANFLDIGGKAKSQQVKDALDIILKDKDVTTIFINIFGEIVRCDLVAEGIIDAKKSLNIKKPMVIKLIGTNDQKAYKMLKNEGMKVYTTMTEAAKKAVEISKK